MSGCQYAGGLIGDRDGSVRDNGSAEISHASQQLLSHLPKHCGDGAKNQKAEHDPFKAPSNRTLTEPNGIASKHFHGEASKFRRKVPTAHIDSFPATQVIRSMLCCTNAADSLYVEWGCQRLEQF